MEVPKGHGKATSSRKWGGKIEFYLSLIGYALGTSDVWRFPYLIYRNGGGAFLVPFIIFLALCGFPLLYAELAVSQFSGKGTYRVWDMCPLFRGIGVAVAVFNLADLVPGVLIRVWIVQYIWDSFQARLPWTSCQNDWNTASCISNDATVKMNVSQLSNTTVVALETVTVTTSGFPGNVSVKSTLEAGSGGMTAAEEYWQYKVLDMSDGIDSIGVFNWKYLIIAFVIRLLICLSLLKSVKVIGKIMYATTIVPIALTIVMWANTMTLPGAFDGMKYLFTPDFSSLGNVNVWIEGGFMAFYTLGSAWGGFIVIGAHNRFDSQTLRFTGLTVVCDTLCALLSACLIFSVLGVMAAEGGGDVDNTVSAGLALTFVTIPQAVTYLPVPQLWLVIFFLIVMLVTFDAQMMLMETGLCTIEEAFPDLFQRRRPLLVSVISVILFLLSIPFMFQNGVYLLQLIDWYLATFTTALIALLESLVFFWIYGSERLSVDIEMMIGRRLPVFIRLPGAFAVPLLMVGLLTVSIVKYKPPNYGAYTYPEYARAIGWISAMASVVPIVIFAFLVLSRVSGGPITRLRKACAPTGDWGPADPDLREKYEAIIPATPSSWRRQVCFNVVGARRTTRAWEPDHFNEEMETLSPSGSA